MGSPGGLPMCDSVTLPNTGGQGVFGPTVGCNLYGFGSMQVYQLRNQDNSSQGFDAGPCPSGAECWLNQWGDSATNTGTADDYNYAGVVFDGNADDTVWHCGNCAVIAIQNYGLAGCYLDSSTYAARQGGCFSPETRIRMWDGSSKRADEIHGGDLVLNPIKRVALKVERVVKGPEKLPLIELGFEGRLVHVTTKHPIPTKDGVKQAISLTRKDFILGTDGNYHALTVLRKLPVDPKQEVINFEMFSDSKDPLDHLILSDGIVTGDLNLQNRLQKAVSLEPKTP
jgi:hypothetical protein